MSEKDFECIFGNRNCTDKCIFYYETETGVSQCLIVALINTYNVLINRWSIWRFKKNIEEGKIKV